MKRHRQRLPDTLGRRSAAAGANGSTQWHKTRCACSYSSCREAFHNPRLAQATPGLGGPSSIYKRSRPTWNRANRDSSDSSMQTLCSDSEQCDTAPVGHSQQGATTYKAIASDAKLWAAVPPNNSLMAQQRQQALWCHRSAEPASTLCGPSRHHPGHAANIVCHTATALSRSKINNTATFALCMILYHLPQWHTNAHKKTAVARQYLQDSS